MRITTHKCFHTRIQHGTRTDARETEKKNNTGILLDTKGPEIRTGFFADDAKKITLKKGENITLTADYNFKGSSKKLACSYPSLATSVRTGQPVLVADGSLVLTVLSCHPSEGEVVCRIENDCSIGERKNMVSFIFLYHMVLYCLTDTTSGYSFIFYYRYLLFPSIFTSTTFPYYIL